MEKVKFELEFPLRASPKMLFPFLSSPSGLSEWFCDDV
ncbi:MAG: START-like domain-containing protein, partial [Schleiferiaceae bacterium]